MLNSNDDENLFSKNFFTLSLISDHSKECLSVVNQDISPPSSMMDFSIFKNSCFEISCNLGASNMILYYLLTCSSPTI